MLYLASLLERFEEIPAGGAGELSGTSETTGISKIQLDRFTKSRLLVKDCLQIHLQLPRQPALLRWIKSTCQIKDLLRR